MPLNINPPLLNSASPWATTYDDLKSLYLNPATGAITTRTSLIDGFEHNASIHQHCFTSPADSSTIIPADHKSTPSALTSLNTYGYSPHPLSTYLSWSSTLLLSSPPSPQRTTPKPITISITGTPSSISAAYPLISQAHSQLPSSLIKSSQLLYIELNLSCPNIAHAPPPAYSPPLLLSYLSAIASAKSSSPNPSIPTGIKLPPYTYPTQFTDLISTLLASATPEQGCPIDFITATNTLGSSLILAPPAQGSDAWTPALSSASGTGIGGLAGTALHPLALGNVATLRHLLDEHEGLRDIEIIGVGGVSDHQGYERMRSVGASAVGVATALGAGGINVFAKILGSNERKTSVAVDHGMNGL